MDSERSDAFVFFGATGDLAFKQIFPAYTASLRRRLRRSRSSVSHVQETSAPSANGPA